MATTIQITENLKSALNAFKLFERETYEEIVWGLIEDTKELSEQAKKEIAQARAEIKAGKTKTLSEVKKEIGI